MSKRLPMSTARKDGKAVLCLLADGEAQTCVWDGDHWCESYRHEDLYENQPICWIAFEVGE